MNLTQFRQKYPQYNGLDDDTLVHRMHDKYYPDLDFSDFARRIGYSPSPSSPGPAGSSLAGAPPVQAGHPDINAPAAPPPGGGQTIQRGMLPWVFANQTPGASYPISTITGKPVVPWQPGKNPSDVLDRLMNLSVSREGLAGQNGPVMRPATGPAIRFTPNFLGYDRGMQGVKEAAGDVGRAAGHAAAAPLRMGIDVARTLWGVLGYPAGKVLDQFAANPARPDAAGAQNDLADIISYPFGPNGPHVVERRPRTLGDLYYRKPMQTLADWKKKLTLVDEGMTDAATSLLLGGMGGAYLRWLGEGGEVGRYTAALLRQQGITEPLITTAAKTGISAVIGDRALINPAMAYVDRRLGESKLGPRVKQTIATVAPLVIGLVSGATIEQRIDRMLKNPIAMHFMEGLGRENLSPQQIVERFKAAIDEDVEKTGIGKLAETEKNISAGKHPVAMAEKARETAGDLDQQQLADEINARLHISARPQNPAAEAAQVFEDEFRRQNAAHMDRLRPQNMEEAINRSVDATTGKSAQQSAQDMANEAELLDNRIRRERVPEAQQQARENPGMVAMINDAAAGRAPSADAAEAAVYQSKLDEIGRIARRPVDYLDKSELLRAKAVTDHNGRKDLSEILRGRIQRLTEREKAQRAEVAKGGETLRSRIQEMGGIDFLNFKGEARDLPPMVRRSIARKDGVPVDLAERRLKDEGWLDRNESLLDLLKYDKEGLRRRNLNTDLAKRSRHLTADEAQKKAQMEYEPEMPDGFEELPGHLQSEVASGRMSMEQARTQQQKIEDFFNFTHEAGRKGEAQPSAKEGLGRRPNAEEARELHESYQSGKAIQEAIDAGRIHEGEGQSGREVPGEGGRSGALTEERGAPGGDRLLVQASRGSEQGGINRGYGVEEPAAGSQGAIHEENAIHIDDTHKQALVDLNFKGRKPASELGEVQTLLMTGGPPGAGKSTSVETLGLDTGKMVQADADKIKEQAGFEHRAPEFHETSSQINKKIADRAIDKGYHLTYDSLLTNYPLADELIQRVLGRGGEASVAFTNIDAATSAVRSNARVMAGLSRRVIPEGASIKGYNRSLPTFIELFKKYRDNPRVNFTLVDNNVDGRNPIPVFIKDNRGMRVLDQKLFDNLMDTQYIKSGTGKEARYERVQKATPQTLRSASDSIRQRAEAIAAELAARRQAALDRGRAHPENAGSSAEVGRSEVGTKGPSAEEGSEQPPEPFKSSPNTLYLHPSTITGPIGGLAAGVDWDEYQKTGRIRFDPKRALIGAIAGIAAPGSVRMMRNLGRTIATQWDNRFAQPFLNYTKDKVNGLIINEDLRHALGMNRSRVFGDMMRDYRRNVEKAWMDAARIGKELYAIAPSKLEQRRMMQIVRGGVTANPVWRQKAEQVNELFSRLRSELEGQELLRYSRFDGLTRRERAKLRNIIARDKDLRKVDEQAFLQAHRLTRSGFDADILPADEPLREFDRVKGFDREPPERATEQIPLSAYDSTPKTSAEWARQKLYDHYHYATAEEYAPLYYDTHEGLTPKQREALSDEIRRLKVRSRRGNPEGNPILENQIAEMEKLLVGGGKERRALRKTRIQLNRRYSHRRIEIPYETQKLLGVIEEAPYPVAKMAGVQMSDVLKGRLFDEISKRSDWAIPTRLKNPATGEMEAVYGGEPPANFAKVDDDRFGALNGMYVRRDIWEDLREVEEWRGAFTRMWDKSLGAWKLGKVVLNPATHARNFMSNIVLAYFGDVHPADMTTYGKAARALQQGEKNAFFKEASDWGLFNDTYVSSEIGKLRDEMEALRDPGAIKNWVRRAVALPGDVYQSNEKFFKMAVFIKARQSGATVDAAARKAERYLFNYADIPPWVKTMRRWVSPFFTFTYKALPLLGETAIRKPHKVAAIAAAMYGMEEYARRRLGMSEQEYESQRAMLPEWQQRRILGIGPHTQVLMPFRDKWGNNLYLDLAYILPFGNMSEKWGQSAIPLSDFMPSNPLFQIAAEIMSNRDAFTGHEIYNDVLDGASQVAAKYMEHAWREIAPSLAPGGYGWSKLQTGLMNSVFGKDVRDWADRPLELSTAVMSSIFGIKMTPAAEQQLKAFEVRTRRNIARAVGDEIGRLKIKRRRNEIDDQEFRDQVEKLKELERKLLNARPKM